MSWVESLLTLVRFVADVAFLVGLVIAVMGTLRLHASRVPAAVPIPKWSTA